MACFPGFSCSVMLLTLFIFSTSTLTSKVIDIVPNLNLKVIPLSFNLSPRGIEDEETLPNNAPLKHCGPAGGVKDGKYIELVGQYMDPPCEMVQGYCRIKRNINYTAIVRYVPKVNIAALHVKTTVVQRISGWETSFWPEYEVCGYANISCPQEAHVTQQGYNTDKLPNEVPPTRGLYRVRVLGTSADDGTKRPYLCRQVYLQFH